VDLFISSCSENYHRDCYILKIDIKGYFMSVDRSLLYEKIKGQLIRQASKSLFHAARNKGLPIGNLTSQLFANIYYDSPQ